MNGNGTADPQRNHVRFIVGAIVILGITCSVCGTVLIFKGYHGDLLIGGVLAAISGLCGFLGAGKPNAPQPDISVSTDPPKAEIKKATTEPTT